MLKLICRDIYCAFVSPSENTRQRSDAFAAENGLPKFEYVLHPRTTGFTFIVERLRKGEDVSHNSVGILALLPGWKHVISVSSGK